MADASLNDLARAAKRGDHHAVLAAYAKLPEDARTPDIVTARIVALIHESKWDDVISCCTSEEHAFHRAYALYKSDRLEEALGALSSLPDSDASTAHLRGQALYRLGRYADCLSLYQGLVQVEEGDEDVRIALLAAAVATRSAGAVLATPPFSSYIDALSKGRSVQVGWELLYNVSCALIACGQPSLAMRALMLSLRGGDEALTGDGLDSDSIADDLSILRCQAAYLLQCAHYDDAASALYHAVMAVTPRVTDVSVPPVLYSNLGAMRGSGRDMLDVYKRLRSGASSLAGCKLLKSQAVDVNFNRAVVAAALTRNDDARAALSDMRAAMDAHAAPDMALRGDILAAAIAGVKSTDLESVLSAGGQHVVTVAARAQSALAAGNATSAAAILSQLQSPAAVASRVQVEMSAGRPDAALAALSTAVTAAADASRVPLLFLRAALHSFRGDRGAAGADYESILASHGADDKSKAAAAASLAILLVESSMLGEGGADLIPRADALVREATGMTIGLGGRRPSFADAGILTSETMDRLEWAALAAAPSAAAPTAVQAKSAPSTPRTATAAASVSAEEAAREAARKAAKHRRALKQRSKRRLAHVARLSASGSFGLLGIPKPDPERWLPKRERTYGKKSRARKIASKMNVSSGGAQGSSGASEALTRELDVKAKTDAAKAKAAASGSAAAPAPATPPPSAGKRKTGGKGRR